jgi:hypothetical protein
MPKDAKICKKDATMRDFLIVWQKMPRFPSVGDLEEFRADEFPDTEKFWKTRKKLLMDQK